MAKTPGYRPYEPQLTPVQRAPDLWTVEGPEVAYGLGPATIPCPTRMTGVRLADGSLWAHSPVRHVPALGDALARLGPVSCPISCIIAPNRYHYTFAAEWTQRYLDAAVFAPIALR